MRVVDNIILLEKTTTKHICMAMDYFLSFINISLYVQREGYFDSLLPFLYIVVSFKKDNIVRYIPALILVFFSKISLILFLLPDVCYYKYPLSKCYIIYQNTSIQNNNHC